MGQSLPGPGNSLTFGGSGYINGGTDNRGITNQVTVEAWVRTSVSAYQWIAGKYFNSNFEEKGYHLYIFNGQAGFNGRVGAGVYMSSGLSSTLVSDGRWHHLAGTYANGTWRIYVDGVLENQGDYASFAPNDLTTTTFLVVGAYAIQNENYFRGSLDEVRVWRTARTAAEIQATMCRKFALAPPELVTYYRFDQSSGLTARDEGSAALPQPRPLVGFGANGTWALSGAALGDASSSLYAGGGLATGRVGVASATGDSAVVISSLGPAARGVQVYAVNSPPTLAAGAGAASTYFGVFTAGGPALPFSLRLRPATGASCRGLQQRQANDQAWVSLPVTLAPTGTSVVPGGGPLSYRGEFITTVGSATPPITIGGDSAVCSGATGQLTASAPGATAFRWSTGATTATLSGLAPGSYSVTVTFGGGCTATARRTVRVLPVPVVSVAGDSTVCAGTTTSLTASAPGATAYRWNTGATGPTLAGVGPGSYSVTVSYGSSCATTARRTVRLRGAAVPAFSLGADSTLCDGGSVLLRGPVGPGLSYQWQDGSTAATLLATAAGTYSLTVRSACGSATASRALRLQDCIRVPNVFTPNGDNLNPAFEVEGLRGSDWDLAVFNRWGREVYRSASYQNGAWGREAAAGLYYVLLTRPSTGYRYKGWVEVIR